MEAWWSEAIQLQFASQNGGTYTGGPFPMRSGVVYLIEPSKVQQMTLPFEHAPA